MNTLLRITISVVTALVVVFLLSTLSVLIEIEGTLVIMIIAGLGLFSGKCLNDFLKKRYPPKE